jgi:hypothetical protein
MMTNVSCYVTNVSLMWGDTSKYEDQHAYNTQDLNYTWGVNMSQNDDQHAPNTQDLKYMLGVTCPKLMTNMLVTRNTSIASWGHHVSK